MLGAWALFRAAWLSAVSYRLRTLISIGGIAVAAIPLYFISGALQPVVAGAIRDEGGQYFGFLIVGTIVMGFLPVAVQSIPGAVNGAIGAGTLETLLDTPTSVGGVLTGLVAYDAVFNAARSIVLLAAGALLGATFSWSLLPAALVVLALIVVAHIPFGLMAAAGILAFRTAGPLPQGILVLSSLLGGVYYPTKVIPGWLVRLADVTPLSYGLRALRRVLLQGELGAAVWHDVAWLVAFAVPLWLVATLLFAGALRYARRMGQLGRY